MASDDIVWSIINNQHCSFKLKTTKDQTFCRNEYNVTGFCSKQACPLANSRYATVRADPVTGRLYLYMRTIERAHLPRKWWERIRLPARYEEALAVLDGRLEFWPRWLVHKCKQRLTRLTQVAIRTRRLARERDRLGEALVPKLASKVRRREATRERKAEAAAKVERAIERELVERLRSGAYGDRPINVEEGLWKKVLKNMEKTGEMTGEAEELEEEDEYEDDEEESLMEWEGEGDDGLVEYVSDIDSDSEDENIDDLEDWMGSDSNEEDNGNADESDKSDENDKFAKALANLKRKRQEKKPSLPKKKTKGPKQNIYYEEEEQPPLREMETVV